MVIHTVLFHADGRLQFGGSELLDAPLPEGASLWVDIEGRTRDYADRLLAMGYHPLAVEDVFLLQHQPKLEEYPGYLFVIVRGIDVSRLRLETLKLAAFLEPNRLVTCHRAPMRGIATVRRKLSDTGRARPNMPHLFYMICDELVDHYFPIVEEVGGEFEELEEEIFENPRQQQLERIQELRRRMSTLRRVLLPHRQIFNRLASRQHAIISEQEAIYFRDLYDSIFRLLEAADHQREQLASAKDTYLSAIAQRTNDVMKVLTLFSALLLPLTFITGIYGMNFEVLPGAGWRWGFYIVLGGMGLLAGGMILWFRRKRWL
jgi:magnesium transporter